MKTESTQMNTEQNVGWFKQNYVALTTIWIKECTRFLRIWVQTLVPPAITMSLYFVIFGSLIGNRIGEMGGFTYMEFIVPGLIMMSVITNSYANVSSSFFSAKFQRNIEELLVSPVPTSVIILGYVGGGVARLLAKEGAKLTLSDVNQDRAESLAAELGADTAAPDAIMSVACDVFSPSSDGGSVRKKSPRGKRRRNQVT